MLTLKMDLAVDVAIDYAPDPSTPGEGIRMVELLAVWVEGGPTRVDLLAALPDDMLDAIREYCVEDLVVREEEAEMARHADRADDSTAWDE